MKTFWILPFCALLALAGCERQAPTTRLAVPSAGGGLLALANPIQSGDVTVIPIVNPAPPAFDQDVISLTEAREKGLVEIVELEEGAMVETLSVTNLSDRPLLLMAGELLLGGRQDRVVAKDTLVPPGETVQVPVFCVEEGRWSGGSVKFAPADTTVPTRVRREVAFGTQASVWSSISAINRDAGVPESAGTTVNHTIEQERVKERVEASLPQIVAELDRVENVVGVALVRNGKVETIELYGNENLFRATKGSILRGFLADAATSPKANAKAPSAADVQRLVDEILQAQRENLPSAGLGMNAQLNSRTVRGVELKRTTRVPTENVLDTLIHGTYVPR
jgi:hypothetical protein